MGACSMNSKNMMDSSVSGSPLPSGYQIIDYGGCSRHFGVGMGFYLITLGSILLSGTLMVMLHPLR